MNGELDKKIPSGRWAHIIIPAILVYIVSFMDRTNIGFAMAGGMSETLKLTSTTTGLAAGIFFIGYLVLQVPGGIIAERGNAKKFMIIAILCWGVLAVVGGFVQNITQLYIVRFLLGVAEGGVFPCLLTILSHWFPSEERGRANAYFMMNIPIASIITGPVSGIILAHYNWRYVFILEGAMAFLLLCVWIPLITNYPSEAKWVSKEEKDFIEGKLKEEQAALVGNEVTKLSMGTLLSNGNVWKLILIYFGYNTGFYGFSLWLPSILKQLTHSGISGVGWLSTIPYIFCIIGLYVISNLADKSMNRRLYTAISIGGFSACLIFSVVTTSHIWVSFAGLVGCGIFFEAVSGVFWTLPTLIFDKDMASGSRGIINGLGCLGGFVGPYLVGYLNSNLGAGSGMIGLAIFLGIAFVITLTLPQITTGKINNLNSKQTENV